MACCLRYCKSTIFQANHNLRCRCCLLRGCLRYCKSTIFQANHNLQIHKRHIAVVVCDTAKVRFFKQITTATASISIAIVLFAILQKYDFSSKSQLYTIFERNINCCLRYCKSTIFQANHNWLRFARSSSLLFAILQKYDFSSKSQLSARRARGIRVVCDTAKVRFFKQITTRYRRNCGSRRLFAILQKYDFSSKSQPQKQLS